MLGVETNERWQTIALIVEHPTFEQIEVGDPIPSKMLMMTKRTHEDHSWVSKVEYAS